MKNTPTPHHPPRHKNGEPLLRDISIHLVAGDWTVRYGYRNGSVFTWDYEHAFGSRRAGALISVLWWLVDGVLPDGLTAGV